MAVGPLVGVEGEPAVLEALSPFPSEDPRSVAEADAASEPVVAVVVVAATVIAK